MSMLPCQCQCCRRHAQLMDKQLAHNAALSLSRQSEAVCPNCAKVTDKLVCLTCVQDAQAAAIDDYHRSDRAKVHELSAGDTPAEPVHGWPDHLPVARFTGFYDEGDESVGIWPAVGWVLSEDQSGTLIEHMLEHRFRVPQNVAINPISWDTLAEYRRRAEHSVNNEAEDWLNAQLVTTPSAAQGQEATTAAGLVDGLPAKWRETARIEMTFDSVEHKERAYALRKAAGELEAAIRGKESK